MAFNYNLQHLIWSTSGRRNWIHETLQPRLFEYIGGIVRNRDSVLLNAGGMPDHVHLLISLHPTLGISDIVNTIKSNSSRWIHENYLRWPTFVGKPNTVRFAFVLPSFLM